MPPLPLPALLLTFAISLLITLRAATWFTRTLEAISDLFDRDCAQRTYESQRWFCAIGVYVVWVGVHLLP